MSVLALQTLSTPTDTTCSLLVSMILNLVKSLNLALQTSTLSAVKTLENTLLRMSQRNLKPNFLSVLPQTVESFTDLTKQMEVSGSHVMQINATEEEKEITTTTSLPCFSLTSLGAGALVMKKRSVCLALPTPEYVRTLLRPWLTALAMPYSQSSL